MGDINSTDDAIAQEYGPVPLQQAAAQQDVSASDFTDEQIKSRYSDTSPDKPSDPSFFAPLTGFAQYIGNKWQGGEASIVRGGTGDDIMAGHKTYEEMKDTVNTEALQQLKERTGNYEGTMNAWDPRRWLGGLSESLPFLREQIEGGVKGAVPGAVIGGGIGAVSGAVLGPGEAITIPVGVVAGAEWGYKSGEFLTAAKISGGNIYMDLRDQGISHDTAKMAGLAGGAGMGFLQTLSLDRLSAPARKAVLGQLTSEAGKKTALNFFMGYAKSVGIQTSLADAQTAVDLLTHTIAGWADKNPGAIPSMDDWKKQLVDTTIQSAGINALLVGGSELAGHVASKVTGKIVGEDTGLLNAGKSALLQAFETTKQGMENMRPTKEGVLEARKTDVNTILDQLQQPIHPSESTPLVGRLQEIAKQVLESKPLPQSEEPQLHSFEMQARVKQIDTDMEQLDKQINQVEKEIASRDIEFAKMEVMAVEVDFDSVQERVAGLEKKFNNQESKSTASPELVAKLEAAYDEQKILDKRLKKAKRVLANIDVTKTAVKGLQNKLDKLYSHRGSLDTERALIKEGLLKPEEIKNAKAQMTVGQISAFRAKATDKIIQNFRKGVKAGIRYSKDDVKMVQNHVTSLIQDSGMTPKDKAKFISRIKSIQTQAQLQKALPEIQRRIDNLVENEAIKQAHIQMDKVLGRTELAKQGKYKVSKFTGEIQTILDTYRNMIRDPEAREEAIQQKMNLIQREMEIRASVTKDILAGEKNAGIPETPQFTEREALHLAIAERVGAYETKSAREIQALADEIQEIVDTGKAKAITKKLQAKEIREQNIQTAIDAINGTKPVDSSDPFTSKLSLNTKTQQLTRLKRTLGRTLNTWDGILAILSQHDIEENRLADVASVFNAVKVEANNNLTSVTKLIDTLIESTPLNRKAILDAIVQGSVKKEIADYVDATGKWQKLYATHNEAINMWNQFHDPDLERGLKTGNKFTWPEEVQPGEVSTYEALSGYLSENDKLLASGLVNFYSDFMDERFNPEWEKATGATLDKNDFYSGYAQRKGYGEDEQTNFFNENVSRSSTKPKSAIARTDNALALEPQDAFIKAIKHIQQVEHWIAWRETDQRVRPIFTNQDVRNTIKLKYGDGMLRTVDFQYNDMIGTRPQQQNEALKILDVMRRNAGTAFVGGKAISFVKQYVTIVNFLLTTSAKDLAAGIFDFWHNPLDIPRKVKLLESAPMMKTRSITLDRDLMEQMTRADITRFKEGPALGSLTHWFVKYGDRAMIWQGGWAVYKAALKRTGDHEQALDEFQKAFNSISGSGTVDQISQLGKSGPMGKMLTLFKQQPLKLLEYEVNSVRKALSVRTPENIHKAARTIAITHASSMLFQAVGSAVSVAFGASGIETESLKQIRALILGPVNDLPLLGDVINSATTLFTNFVFDGKEKIWAPSSLVTDIPTHTVKLLKDLGGDFQQGSIDLGEFFTVLEDYARGIDLLMPPSLAGGVPKEPIIKFLQDITATKEDKKNPNPNADEDTGD